MLWGDDVRSRARAAFALAVTRCKSSWCSPPKSRTTIPTPPPPQWTGAPEATDRGADSDARAGSPHPLTAAAGAVTRTPAGTGTGSTRTRSVHSSAGSFRCCPPRLPERAVRLLLRQQRRHRLAAVSWHSPRLVSPIADPLLSLPEDALPTRARRAATGPFVPERAAAEHPCRRAVCACRRRGPRLCAATPARRGAHPQSGCLRGRTQ